MATHTPGPWRWEFNAKSKNMHLVGGVPMYDLTVMDFERWGTQGACVRLREDVDRMNIMHRLPDRPDWIAPFPNREHHASWCAGIVHPDMRLIAAAPDLLVALISARDHLRETLSDPRIHPIGHCPTLDYIETVIAKATGAA